MQYSIQAVGANLLQSDAFSITSNEGQFV
jgi:hypothetical protein